MTDQSFPVSVEVRRADGSTERVRVGTATKSDDGFILRLGELTIGSTADAPRASSAASAPRRAAGAGSGGGGDGTVFPPYGRSKGQPVYGATLGDLEFYANGCRRTLADQGKARWHDKERVLLAAIEAEIARQNGGGGGGNDDGFSGGGQDGPPPLSDDDIPF
jgi:hypothetical protein